jgi:hypothetical protein
MREVARGAGGIFRNPRNQAAAWRNPRATGWAHSPPIDGRHSAAAQTARETIMFKTILVTASAALIAVTAAAPAHALISGNGVTPNGTQLNAMSLNAITPNGIKINGKDINGTQLNGKDVNGKDVNGTQLNGKDINGKDVNGTQLNGMDSPNGKDINGFSTNAISMNALTANGKDVNGHQANGGERSTLGFAIDGIELPVQAR